jgi:hypothetical protein
MPLNSIDETLNAFRVVLRDLDLLPPSAPASQLKHILLERIAELEKVSDSSSGAEPVNRPEIHAN